MMESAVMILATTAQHEMLLARHRQQNHRSHHHNHHQHQRGCAAILVVALVYLLNVTCCCSAYSVGRQSAAAGRSSNRVDEDATEIDQFYFPTDQGLREFQQILLRGLGLTRVPDLSKVNITRDEYDRLKLGEDDEGEIVTSEYRRFQADSDEERETVILNHGHVRASSQHGFGWTLHFQPPASSHPSTGSQFVAESSKPLELHWIGPSWSADGVSASASPAADPWLPGHRHWRLKIAIGDLQQSVEVRPEDFNPETNLQHRSVRLAASHIAGYLDRINAGVGGENLRVRATCAGRDCHYWRQWQLGGQLRLVNVVASHQPRAKRHTKRPFKTTPQPKKVTKPTKSAPQPKDILVKKTTRSSPSCGSKGAGKKCCPHSLKINFRQLPGFDWILEPSEIDIYMCKGECHYAQFSHSPASNHALFQGYLHTVNRRLVPKLCCTPSKLESVQIVHYDQEDPTKLTTTKWEGAIVSACACA